MESADGGSAFVGWFADKSCKKKLNPAGYDNRKPKVKIAMPTVFPIAMDFISCPLLLSMSVYAGRNEK